MRRPQNLKKISHLFWQNSCFHSVVSKQVGDFFKFLWSSQKNWTLRTHVNMIATSYWLRSPVSLRRRPNINHCGRTSNNLSKNYNVLFCPKIDDSIGTLVSGTHWSIQLWCVSYYYTHSLYHFINSAIVALKSDIVTFYRC